MRVVSSRCRTGRRSLGNHAATAGVPSHRRDIGLVTLGRSLSHSGGMQRAGREILTTGLAVISYSLLGAFGSKLLFNWLAGPSWLLFFIVCGPRFVRRLAPAVVSTNRPTRRDGGDS